MSKEEARKMRNSYVWIDIILLLIIMFSIFVLRGFSERKMQRSVAANVVPQRSITYGFTDGQAAESFYALSITVENLALSIDGLRLAVQAQALESTPAEPTAEQTYWRYVNEITNNYYPDVDPDYVYAVIYHESRFEADAVNKNTGVVGLMQVSPKWHTERAKSLGVTDLKDPYGNILVGCDILHELTQKKDFNYALNFFAGGYPYANRYQGKKSPYISELEQIMGSGELEALKGGA